MVCLLTLSYQISTALLFFKFRIELMAENCPFWAWIGQERAEAIPYMVSLYPFQLIASYVQFYLILLH